MNDDQPQVGLKNWVLFLVGATAVMALWGNPAAPPLPLADPAAPGEALSPSPTANPGLPAAYVPPDAALAVADIAPALGAVRIERTRVESTFASVEFTTRGGRITSWQLPGHAGYWSKEEPLDLVRREVQDENAPLGVRRIADDADILPLQVVTGDAGLDRVLNEALYDVSVVKSGSTKLVTLAWSDGRGTAIEKKLRLSNDDALIDLDCTLSVNGVPRSFQIAWGPGIGDHAPAQKSDMYFRHGQIVYSVAGEREELLRKDEDSAILKGLAIDWVALEDSFFTVIFIPGGRNASAPASLSQGFEVGGALPPLPSGEKRKDKEWPDFLALLAPFSPQAPHQSLYVGPRQREVLEETAGALHEPQDIGSLTKLGSFIGPIAEGMRQLLIWLQAHVGNWGVSIILLTIIIRGVLFPLTHMSMKKMRMMQDKMKVLKPQLDALKKKHAPKRGQPKSMESRQAEQKATMELYQAAGINPGDQLLGCLPLFISIPFFWALFQLLKGTIEFRHMPFLAWDDLASADPWHIWPLLTGATTYLSQKLSMSGSSAGGNPEMENMQKMMLRIFPLMFIGFCWSAPLGLVLYWTTNNLIQIAQYRLLKRTLPEPESDSTGKKSSKKDGKKALSSTPSRDAKAEEEPNNEATAPSRSKKRKKR